MTALEARVSALELTVAALSPPLTQTGTNVAPGQCISITHNFNTRNVGWAAWMSDPSGGPWIPVQPGNGPPTTNLALNRTATASSVGYGAVFLGNDGDASTQWLAPSSMLGSWTVDLGSVQSINSVRLIPSLPGVSGTTSWDVVVSTDGVTFSAPVTSGVCALATCSTYSTSALPNGTTARFVRVVVTSGAAATATLAELEVFSQPPTIALPDANSIRLCNHTPFTRDLALRVFR